MPTSSPWPTPDYAADPAESARKPNPETLKIAPKQPRPKRDPTRSPTPSIVAQQSFHAVQHPGALRLVRDAG
jgi:hypothetical protein